MNKKNSKNLSKKRHYDDDEEEEDEEDENQYEDDGFIVKDNELSDVDDEDESDSGSDDDSENFQADSLSQSDLSVLGDKFKKNNKPKKGKLKKAGKKIDEDDFNDFDDFEDKKERREDIKQEAESFDDEIDDEEQEVRIRSHPKKKSKPVANKNSSINRIFGENQEEIDNYDQEDEEKQISNEDKLKKISKFYAKEEIEEHYITERDDLIKKLDFPERVLKDLSEIELNILAKQVKEDTQNNLLTTTQEEISAETEFIFDRLRYRNSTFDNENISNIIRAKIRVILENMKNMYFEIPYIITYRKFLYETELNSNDVWKIYQLDLEWKKLNSYKKNIQKQIKIIRLLNIDNLDFLVKKYIDKVRTFQELKYMEAYVSYYKDNFSEEITKKLEEKKRETELDIIEAQLKNNNLMLKEENSDIEQMLKLEEEEQRDKKLLHKRPVKQIVIPKSSKINCLNLGKKFSLTPYQFSMNIDLMRNGQLDSNKFYIPNDPEEEPQVLSLGSVDSYFPNNLELMKCACSLLASEILVYPPFRLYFFNILKSYAKLCSYPTEKGIKELDIFNPSFRVKRLRNKPLQSFTNDLFLDIIRCEKEGLITYAIDIDNEDKKSLFEKLRKCYNKVINTELNKKWNTIRLEVIKAIMSDGIVNFKKEIVTYMTEQAENNILEESASKFRDLLLTGSYKLNPTSKCIYFEESPKVLSFIFDFETNTTVAVTLDEYGNIKDTQNFYFLYTRLNSQPKNDFNKDILNNSFINNNNSSGINLSSEFCNETNGESEYSKLKELLKKHSPQLIVIGSNNIKTRQIKENVTLIAQEVLNSNEYEIMFGDTAVPYIFATSNLHDQAYLNFDTNIKQAISLGRFKQNPLAEILQLWHEDPQSNNCLNLNLHPLQKCVNQTKLLERLELEAIRIVNLVGVDINRIKDSPHTTKQLNFVSGLGPRKAAYIIEKISMSGELVNRKDTKLFLNDRVITNCCGFIKIKLYSILKSNNFSNLFINNPNVSIASELNKHCNLLDLTRIHPDSYHYAREMIKAVVENDQLDENEKIEKVLLNPDVLLDLDINDTISKYKQQGNFTFEFVINFVINELKCPFKDYRKEHKQLDEMELFKCMTSDYPIEIGNIVLAKSNKVGKTTVFCKLENDLEAVLWKNDIFEDGSQHSEDIEEKMNQMYPKNSLFYARVKSINKSTFKVDLITKPSRLRTHRGEDIGRVDEYFVYDEEQDYKNHLFTYEENREKSNRYTKRNINHPKFKNYNYMQCTNFLKNKEIGDFIFRPSSKNNNCLTLSWKFYDNVISHITINEEDKAKGANIGAKLKISDDVYSSLYEIADRFVAPCRRIVLDSITNRKFIKFNSVEEMEDKLKQDKKNDSMIIHYIFTINPAYPQYIILAYIPKMNQVIKEFMKVKPRGLYFHNIYFNDLNEVTKYFKENYNLDPYRSYVRKIKPPGEEQMTDNNFGSYANNFNNINSGFNSIRNDINSNSYLGSKRHKSPNAYDSNNYGSNVNGK